ncbi:MAG: M10 family metallopeptidase C-terminal domain-containing protein [Pseudolabrys sp.]|nr:M10 family metallopeptidase C-terminal domain-containing protein [Pseudolabrys sp.]
MIETTDAASGTGTTYTLAVGDTAQGHIGFLGDSDWYRVNLVAGQTYTVAIAGEGATSNNLQDPYLTLRNGSGASLAVNDDSGPGSYSSLTFTAGYTGTYYLDAQAYNNGRTGQYGLSIIEGSKANYDTAMGAGAVLVPNTSWSGSPATGITVTYGFRQSTPPYSVDDEPNTQTTFSQLTVAEIAAVHTIMQLWGDVSGVTFTEVNPGGYTNNATILFSNYNDPNDGAGAFAFYPVYGQTGGSAYPGDVYLNTDSVSTSSLAIGTYSFFAIMHEVGHALGLAHPGDYNAAPGVNITYAGFAQFIQDSQQTTVMSYFDETNTGAQFFGYADTPMLFDVYALQQLYGVNMTTRTGDTVYGFGSNAGSVYDFSQNTTPAMCIWDAGGNDTLDCSGFGQNQIINLNVGMFSNVGGLTKNISVAIGATLENAVGGSGADTIVGNDANNTIIGNNGDDTLYGNDGSDTIIARTGDGNDTINGGNGFDTLDLSTVSGAIQINVITGVITGTAGTDTMIDVIEYFIATNFDDVFVGDSRANAFFGSGGNDMITGNGGSDWLSGGDGSDRFVSTTGDGNDTLIGGNGFDTLDYSAVGGAVQVDQQTGFVIGAAGNDTMSDSFEYIIGTGSNDQMTGDSRANALAAGAGNDIITGNGGNDWLSGGDGNDTFIAKTGDGNDTLIGGNGFDTLDYSAVGGGVQVNQVAGTTGGAAGNDTMSDSFEFIVGSNFADVLTGNNANNALKGGGGDDTINGGGGNDWIAGGTGNDSITLGLGSDVVLFLRGDGHDTIADFLAGPGVVDVINLRMGASVTSFADVLARATQSGSDTVLDFSGGDMITLLNVNVGLLHNDDFTFT